MTSLTIDLPDHIDRDLRLRAERHGRSAEAEASSILRAELIRSPARPSPRRLGDAIVELFQPMGGVELELPTRTDSRAPPRFGE